MLDQLIFTDEAARAGVPVPFLTINTVGPTIMRFGTARAEGGLPAPDHRRRDPLLHRLLRAGGGHRPGRAAHPRGPVKRRRGQYVINGQKMWTSLIQYADYVWLACRTDPDAPRHKGLSILIVPDQLARVLLDAGAHHGRARPPARRTTRTCGCPPPPWSAQENQGWQLITNQLNHERVALTSAAPVRAALREVREWARATKLANGERVIDQEWVQLNLARVHAKAEFLKLINWRIAAEAGTARARRRRRRPRCSAPSSPSRPTAC